jgi:hypothetical protein
VARVAGQPDVDLIVDPETTNIKLVARWREIDDQGANVTESRSGAV